MLGSFLCPILAFGLPGHGEWIILLILGLLIFGRRLPEVGRSIGRSIVEFKRGIKGIDDEIEDESSHPAPAERLADQRAEARLPEGGSAAAADAAHSEAQAEPASKIGPFKTD